jgi:hypothetical protein
MFGDSDDLHIADIRAVPVFTSRFLARKYAVHNTLGLASGPPGSAEQLCTLRAEG